MSRLLASISGRRKYPQNTAKTRRLELTNISFYQFGWGPCCWILVSEIPTARLRSMNVALGAATQWLFNFIIARSKCGMLVLLNLSMTLLTTYLQAVLTMQQTMGEAGYVCVTPDQVQVQVYQTNRRRRECSSCLDPFASSWAPSFGSLSLKLRGSAWRRWTNCSAWLP